MKQSWKSNHNNQTNPLSSSNNSIDHQEIFSAKLISSLDSLKQDFLKNFAQKHPQQDSTNLTEEQEIFNRIVYNRYKHEIVFYTTVVDKLKEYIWEISQDTIYLFFDIDETIAKKSYDNLDDNTDYIRPSLKTLLETLKVSYPHIIYGICSGRGQEAIDRFINIHSDYNFALWYSSRELLCDSPDKSRWELCPNWHYNKAHAMTAIRVELQTDKCFLVDDIIQSQFEEKKMGICIPGGEFYNFPGEESS